MLKTKIASFIDKFNAIAPSWVQNQDQGVWKDESQDEETQLVYCCFGAAVAKAFDCSYNRRKNKYIFQDGGYELARHLHLNNRNLNTLLWLCGASTNPFSSFNWELPCKTVLANLSKIEHEPTDEEFHILYEERMVLVRHSPRTIREIWDRITDSERKLC